MIVVGSFHIKKELDIIVKSIFLPVEGTSMAQSFLPHSEFKYWISVRTWSILLLPCLNFLSSNPSPVVLLQDELENFPLHTIQMCQAVLNQTRYPSVLLLVCQDKEQHKPDIHFFHCDEVEVRLSLSVTGSARFASFTLCSHDRSALCFFAIHKPKVLLLEH